mmetsp:Transcript_12926/g.29754  ORF Transcript_12926/g.29754 Transcript_12926/m.29754 type:complete len:91 (+) Transcript_12926:1708-1980(+)
MACARKCFLRKRRTRRTPWDTVISVAENPLGPQVTDRLPSPSFSILSPGGDKTRVNSSPRDMMDNSMLGGSWETTRALPLQSGTSSARLT